MELHFQNCQVERQPGEAHFDHSYYKDSIFQGLGKNEIIDQIKSNVETEEGDEDFKLKKVSGVLDRIARMKMKIQKMRNEIRKNSTCKITDHSLSEQEILPYQALKEGQQAGPHDMAPFLAEDIIKEEAFIDLPYVASRY